MWRNTDCLTTLCSSKSPFCDCTAGPYLRSKHESLLMVLIRSVGFEMRRISRKPQKLHLGRVWQMAHWGKAEMRKLDYGSGSTWRYIIVAVDVVLPAITHTKFHGWRQKHIPRTINMSGPGLGGVGALTPKSLIIKSIEDPTNGIIRPKSPIVSSDAGNCVSGLPI